MAEKANEPKGKTHDTSQPRHSSCPLLPRCCCDPSDPFSSHIASLHCTLHIYILFFSFSFPCNPCNLHGFFFAASPTCAFLPIPPNLQKASRANQGPAVPGARLSLARVCLYYTHTQTHTISFVQRLPISHAPSIRPRPIPSFRCLAALHPFTLFPAHALPFTERTGPLGRQRFALAFVHGANPDRRKQTAAA